MILGIDQGTTGTKAVLMASDGRVVASAYRAHTQHNPEPGWVEHDAEEIWQAVLACVAELCVEAAGIAGAPPAVHAIGLANQGETVVAWDRVTGEPLYRALVWQDMRAQDIADTLAKDERLVEAVRERTGLRIDAYFVAPKARWLLKHVPQVAAALAAERLCIGTLDSWLLWKMTGGQSFVTDPSTAARTLYFDVRRGQYDQELLDRLELPLAALAAVVPSDGHFGYASFPGTGLAHVPVRASVVDQPAALFGQGCLAPGDTKATFGTGCFVYLNTGNTFRPSTQGLLSTLAWHREGQSTYALDGGIFAAGSVVTWLRDRLEVIGDERDIDPLLNAGRAGGAEEIDAVVCVPAFAGLAAPYWRRDARAAFLGLDLSTSRADVVRAALNGIACRVAQVVTAMEQDSGLAVQALRVDGGLTRCRNLMQLQADLLGVPVHVVEEPEATAMGVCYLAARSVRMWKSDAQVLQTARIAATYEPRLTSERRTAIRQRFTRAVELVKEWS